MPMPTRVVDEFLSLLISGGVTRFLGIPGGAIGPFYDALKEKSIEPVNVRHETNAAFMCAGMWTASRVLGSVAVTSGPGLTNVLTGVASAKLDKIPMVLLVGEVPTNKYGKGALQEGTEHALNVKNMLRSVTKCVVEVLSQTSMALEVKHAFEQMMESGNMGPIAFILPLDVMTSMMRTRKTKISSVKHEPDDDGYNGPHFSSSLDDEQMFADDVILAAKNPLIVIGSELATNTYRSYLLEDLGKLSEKLGATIITSPRAKDCIVQNRTLGVFGYGGQLGVQTWLQTTPPDLVLFLGADLDEVSTNNWSSMLTPEIATTIQVTEALANSSKNISMDYVFKSNPYEFVSWLWKLVEYKDTKPTENIISFVEDVVPSNITETSRHPTSVIDKMQRVASEDTIFCSDIGEHLLFAVNRLKMNGKNKFIAATAFGSMGSGIGNAVGAAMASPTKKVICFCGDFGFQMYGMDIVTAIEQKLSNLVFVVLNDSRMGMVDNGQNTVFGRSTKLSGTPMNFARLSHCLTGIQTLSFQTPDKFTDKELSYHLQFQTSPMILDFAIDPSVKFSNNNRVSTLANFGKEE